jgi:diguanylate cyclase (GGDEF)-like protein
MTTSPSPDSLSPIPTAFAEACRVSQTDTELFERCRDVLVERFGSEQVWFTIRSKSGTDRRVGAAAGYEDARELVRLENGQTELTIAADPGIASSLRRDALPLAWGLLITLELRSILLERQSELDDAVFQLRALRQVARLLASVHSTDETEHLIVDFTAEVFIASWVCLYRPQRDKYAAVAFRSRDELPTPEAIPREGLDSAVPLGGSASACDERPLATLVPPGTQFLVPVDAGSERMAVLAFGPRVTGQQLGKVELELAGTLSFAAAIALKNAALVEELHSAATTDQLTGLYNRRALEERLKAELQRASRHELKTSVVLIDIDNFKLVNDSLGHPAGDRLLVILAKIFSQQSRNLDIVGRLGGDEFLVILPMTSAEEAQIYVKRVRETLRKLPEDHPEFGPQAISLGVAEARHHGSTISTLLRAADGALYRAKRGGGNRVEVAEAGDGAG